MKRLLIIIALLTTATAVAQSAKERIVANPILARGTYSLYPTEFAPLTAVPRGYKPFYISHYGRHGSRFIQANEQFDMVIEQLSSAALKDALTPLGRKLYAKFIAACATCADRAGELSPLGVEQQQAIAERMYRNHPNIFKHDPKISAASTVVPRVILSMSAFTEALVRLKPSLDITTATGRRYMKYLNPYTPDNDPELSARVTSYRFPQAEWSKEWFALRDKTIDNTRLFRSIFKEEYIDQIEDPMTLSENLFRCAISFPGTPANVNIEDIFTAEERYSWWRLMNLFYYVEKGNSGVGGGFISDVSDILLKHIVESADMAIVSERPMVDLRFGHDGNIIGLLNSMGITGWAKRETNIELMEEVACSYTIPMTANLQLIFYRNKQDDVLVKFMLNESELHLPFDSPMAPYYQWSSVREYFIERLKCSTVYKYYNLK